MPLPGTCTDSTTQDPPTLRHICEAPLSPKDGSAIFITIIRQLLDKAEHDIKKYSDQGQCYLAKPKAEADNIDRSLDNS